MSTQSCILYQNPTKTITLIDIPHSIELAQGSLNSLQLISSKPFEHPFPSVDPKSEKARRNLGDSSVDELLLQKFLKLAHQEVSEGHDGDWCLERVTARLGTDLVDADGGMKRKREVDETSPAVGAEESKDTLTKATTSPPETEIEEYVELENGPEKYIFYHNDNPLVTTAKMGTSIFYIPPNSTMLQGNIGSFHDALPLSAPSFNLIVLDPPWPNRSARRKKSYGIAYDSVSILTLLRSIPVESKLLGGGLIGVWITNRASFREMVLLEGGLFDQWNVKHVEEWVWLKVTKSGEMLCALDSSWKKPYEILLVGQRGMKATPDVRRKVIVGVPDIHSRKPNLKGMFESMMGRGSGEYEALEVFARNLTAGWWSWGDEVLKFQGQDHWIKRH